MLGVWLFHCHIEWHVTSGLIATFVEAPLDLQRTLSIPQNHLDVCTVANVPTAGNAAGNTKNFLDLSGQNTPPARLPDGFTARGIVALVFSCLTGILGVLVVGWYGLAKVEEGPSAVGYADQTSDTVAAAEGHTGDARHKVPPMVESVSGGSGAGQA